MVAGFNPGEEYDGRWRSSYFYGLNMRKHNNMWNHVQPPIRYIKHKQQMGVSDSDLFRSKTPWYIVESPNWESVNALWSIHPWNNWGTWMSGISDGFSPVDNWNTLDQHCALEVTGCLPAELLRDVSWRPVHQPGLKLWFLWSICCIQQPFATSKGIKCIYKMV